MIFDFPSRDFYSQEFLNFLIKVCPKNRFDLFMNADIDFAKVLEAFAQSSNKSRNPNLERILEKLAKEGIQWYHWPHLKELLAYEIYQLWFRLDDRFQGKISSGEAMMFLHKFETEAPFTLQRICELLLEARTETGKKGFHTLEMIKKCLRVNTTIPQVQQKDLEEPSESMMSLDEI